MPTNETPQTNRHETTTQFSPEQIELAKNALKVSHVDILREAIFTKRLQEHEAIFDRQEGLTLDELELMQHEADQSIVTENVNIYLSHHRIAEDDDIAGVLHGILQKYSPIAMTEDRWQYGPLDEEGNRDTANSGRELLQQEVDTLFGSDTDNEPGAAEDPEVIRLQGDLDSRRARLAGLSVQRRARLTRRGGRKSRKLSDEYQAAFQEYGAAYTALGEHQVDQLRTDPNVSDEDIAKAVIIGTIAERRAFSEAETEVLTEDNSFKNKIARLYAKKLGMTGINIAVALPVGFTANKLAKYGAIAAVPVAGVAAVASIRAVKSIFTSTIGSQARLHSEFTNRQDHDIQSLSDRFDTYEGRVPIGTNIEASRYARGSEEFLVDSIHGRVHEDIKSNKKRAMMSAAIAGSAAVVAAIAADHIHWPGSDSNISKNTGGGTGADEKTLDEVLREAGVDDPDLRNEIIERPDDFERWVTQADAATETSPEAIVGSPEVGAISDTFVIPQGGGIIRDVIRPAAATEGYHLTPSQESQIWQSMRVQFGDNLFTDLPVQSRGTDQWIMSPGQGTLRPEVALYLKQQIALTRQS